MEPGRSSTILVVDDDEPIRDYLAGVLRLEGYECRCFSESLGALGYLTQGRQQADLLLADIRMPDLDGIGLLRQVKSLYPDLPVILISGLYELALAVDALEAGADDYLKKPVKPSDLVTLVGKHLQPDTQVWEERIQATLRGLVAGPADPKASQLVQDLFQKLGFTRYETFEHSARVATYSRRLGQQCGLSTPELDHLERGALLHDIGKIGIPRNVLLKPGKLNEEEWAMIRDHPNIGYRLLSEFPELREEAALVYSHHERYDGNGYPRGLKGSEIPLGARLFSIVDTYDAITSHRPYRAAQPASAARAEIEKMSGEQFDPNGVRAFLAVPESDLEEIRRRYPESEGTEPA